MEEMTQIMKTIFGGVWDLLSGVMLPGFNISAAKVLIGFFVIKFSLSLLSIVTGFRSNVNAGAEQFRTANESLSHYAKLKQQKDNYDRNGGIGFH